MVCAGVIEFQKSRRDLLCGLTLYFEEKGQISLSVLPIDRTHDEMNVKDLS